MSDAWSRWREEALAPRLMIVRQFRAAGYGHVATLTGMNVLLGVLPVAFVVAISVLIGRVPAAAAGGVGSPAWDRLVAVFLVATALFVSQQLLTPVLNMLAERVKLRVDGALYRRLISTAVGGSTLRSLEDQQALAALTEAGRWLELTSHTPGKAVGAQLALIARYTRLVGFVLLLGTASPPAAAGLLVAVLLFRYGQRGGLRKSEMVWRSVRLLERQAGYLRDVAVSAATAKEIRIFGLARWLSDRYRDVYLEALRPRQRARRRVYFKPYLLYTSVAFVITVGIVVHVGRLHVTGDIDLTTLSLALQSTTAGLMLSLFYPESDITTQVGATALRATREFEERLGVDGDTIPVDPATTIGRPRPVTVPDRSAQRSSDPGHDDPAAQRDGDPRHGDRSVQRDGDPRHGDPATTATGGRPAARTSPRQPAARTDLRQPAAAPTSGALHVRCADLTFRYAEQSRAVLDGLDLELPAGRCTALVGLNGAGKTTLVKLLGRLYEPTSGAIFADGTDISRLDAETWRRQLGVVFQDFVRYDMSAADNISLGAIHASADPDRIRQAARSAGILDVLESLPLGLHTPLSKQYANGADLSGGQWQRIAIARAIFAMQAGARLLILDEPTSALDVRAEARFFDSFMDHTRDVTSLLISHRFSSVRRADHIVVLEHGRVLERGSHESLLAADGRYAQMFRLQAGRYRESDATDVPGQVPAFRSPTEDGVR